MTKRSWLGGLAGATLGALAATIAIAAFTDTQQGSGVISTATASDISLYICKPVGPGTADPLCPGDDGLSSEAIFEGLEKARPGETLVQDIRLRNKGAFAWDMTQAFVSADSSDPNRCPTGIGGGAVAAFNYSILGKAGDSANDNPLAPSYAGALPHILAAEVVREGLGPDDKAVIHVEPNDYEDVRLRVVFSQNMGNNCMSVHFSVVFAAVVDAH